MNFLIKHPKFLNWLRHNKIQEYKGHNLAWDVLGQDEYIQMIKQNSRETMEAYKSIEYEAILNKDGI